MYRLILKDILPILGDSVGTKNSLYYNFPSLETLASGEWLVCCREIRALLDPKGRIRLRRSADCGRTWADGLSPTCHDEREYPKNGFLLCHITELAPGELLAVYMMIHTDEQNPLFHPQTDGMQRTRVRITKSFDNGISWAKPKDLEYEAPDLIVVGKPVKLPDGSVGIPCEMHDLWDEGYKEPLSARFIKSYDRGYTFPEAFIIASAPGVLYGDARLTFERDRLTVFFWTYRTDENRDDFIHRSSSADGGRTWSPAKPIPLKMQITSPLFLEEGLMVCVCQDRFSERPGLKALLSYDGGMNWDTFSELILFGADSRPDGTNPFGQFSQFKFGYSTITKLSRRECAVSFWHGNGASTSVSVAVIGIEE